MPTCKRMHAFLESSRQNDVSGLNTETCCRMYLLAWTFNLKNDSENQYNKNLGTNDKWLWPSGVDVLWPSPGHQRCGKNGRCCQGYTGWNQAGSPLPQCPSASTSDSPQEMHHLSPRRHLAGSTLQLCAETYRAICECLIKACLFP